jgi:hypothetical protein
VFTKKHSDEFISKYSKAGRVWVEGQNWVAETKRKFTQADQKLRDSLKDSEKNLLSKGIASHPAHAIARKFDILEPKDVIRLAKKNPGFAEFLDNYFTERVA